jgi:hypothetical protein
MKADHQIRPKVVGLGGPIRWRHFNIRGAGQFNPVSRRQVPLDFVRQCQGELFFSKLSVSARPPIGPPMAGINNDCGCLQSANWHKVRFDQRKKTDQYRK